MEIYVIPIQQWFYGCDCVFTFDTRYGDMAKVDIVKIDDGCDIYTFDKSQCIIKEPK